MKGEALITVKDKNGNIKNQIKETNVVFDIPKEIVKQILQNIDIGEYNTTSTSPNVSSYDDNPLSFAISYDTWFRSIFINDEYCSESDYKDWKMPVLYGGEYSPQNTSNKRYVYYDTASSSRNGNKLKKVHIWTNCPAFSLKSINLKHDLNSYYTYLLPNDYAGDYVLRKKGQYYFKPYCVYSPNSSLAQGNKYANTLLSKSNFVWDARGGYRKFNAIQISSRVNPGSSGSQYNSAIYALKNNLINNKEEIACLSNLQYVDSILSSTSSEIKYINIINANTGEIERSFPFTQFEGFTGYGAPNLYMNLQYIKIVTTDFGNFIIMPKNTSTTNVNFIWQIPEEPTNDTIPLYLTNSLNTSYAYMSNNYYNLFILNEYIFMLCNGNTNIKTTIRLNDVRNITNPTDEDKITTYDYVPFNISSTFYNSTSSSSNNNQRIAVYNKYYDMVSYGTKSVWETWYNTTALNLAEPVAIAEGDTLTVEYTITAS